MTDSNGRTPSASLRGRLSEVYFPALVTAQSEALAHRLGRRAIVDDPFFGRSSGLADLRRDLAEMARWLTARDAAFECFGLVTGSDRDVTEGTLALSLAGERVRIPVGLVAERRRERAIELRAYYAIERLRDPPNPRRETLSSDVIAVPPPVAAHIDACARGDVSGAIASFELGGTVRDARGVTHAKLEPSGGPLAGYYQRLLSDGGIELLANARADDGRTCALEYTVVKLRGQDVAPRPGLAVYDRGESGLLRTIRVYDDVGP
ncbi:MAG TPA: hypothetical protein VEK07_12045 [Polyangiaceae bacterium]|nr:hypothetical protein [Polyangiaceae bacterium]